VIAVGDPDDPLTLVQVEPHVLVQSDALCSFACCLGNLQGLRSKLVREKLLPSHENAVAYHKDAPVLLGSRSSRFYVPLKTPDGYTWCRHRILQRAKPCFRLICCLSAHASERLFRNHMSAGPS
jgi:hypothetical protein